MPQHLCMQRQVLICCDITRGDAATVLICRGSSRLPRHLQEPCRCRRLSLLSPFKCSHSPSTTSRQSQVGGPRVQFWFPTWPLVKKKIIIIIAHPCRMTKSFTRHLCLVRILSIDALSKACPSSSPVWVGVAAPSLLQTSLPRPSALQEGVQSALPLAGGVQHAAGGAVEQAASDDSLAQAGVQDGLWAQPAASSARPRHLWSRQGQEDASATGHSNAAGRVQVLPVQRHCQGALTSARFLNKTEIIVFLCSPILNDPQTGTGLRPGGWGPLI